MVSPLLNDLRNPIFSSFFLLCKFLQSFLILGGFSFDCSAVAGVFQLLVFFSVPPLRVTSRTWLFFPPRRCGCFSDLRCHFTPTVRGLVSSFTVAGGGIFLSVSGIVYSASEGDKDFRLNVRIVGSSEFCFFPTDVFRSPVDFLFLCFGQYLISSLRRCGKGQTLGHPTDVSATARLRFSIA